MNDPNPVWSRIHYKPFLRYYAENRPSDLYAITDTLCYFPQVRMYIDHGTETPLRQFYHKLFGELYRGWGQFAYNNHDSSEVRGNSIDISRLRIPSFMTDTSESQVNTGDFNISSQTFYRRVNEMARNEADRNNPQTSIFLGEVNISGDGEKLILEQK